MTREFDDTHDAIDFLMMSCKHTSPDQDAAFEYFFDNDHKYNVVQEDDRLAVFLEGVLIGECESYEIDALCNMLGIPYEEVEI